MTIMTLSRTPLQGYADIAIAIILESGCWELQEYYALRARSIAAYLDRSLLYGGNRRRRDGTPSLFHVVESPSENSISPTTPAGIGRKKKKNKKQKNFSDRP